MVLKSQLLLLLIAGLCYTVSCTAVADIEELVWGEWGECSQSCGGGTQSRRAVCDPGLGPQICRFLTRAIARQNMKEEQPCNTQACTVTGTWGDWSEWLPCSSTCGSVAFQARTRSCYQGNDIQEARNCGDGLTMETRPCEELPPCDDTNVIDDFGHHESYSSFYSYDKLSQVEEPSDSGRSSESSYV